MKVTPRTQTIGIALYSLPFIAVIALSLFFVWAGTLEMIVASVALLPALLHFFGVRWSRYVVGVFSAISFVVCSMIPFTRGRCRKILLADLVTDLAPVRFLILCLICPCSTDHTGRGLMSIAALVGKKRQSP